jgi:hypothetical protein
MGGRYGKYGDAKRRQALRKSRDEKHRLEGLRLRARIRRRKLNARHPSGPGKAGAVSDRDSR